MPFPGGAAEEEEKEEEEEEKEEEEELTKEGGAPPLPRSLAAAAWSMKSERASADVKPPFLTRHTCSCPLG